MSLYIHQENQKLLWESMNQHPLFQDYGNNEPEKKEQWFRSIIEKFYESNRFKLLSLKEVQQLNRETVTYMIEDLKKQCQNEKKDPISFYSNASYGELNNNATMSFSPMPFENKDVTRDAILEKKQAHLQSQFSLKQQEYSTMLKNGPDREIDFKEKTQDDIPLENMDKIMENLMKQREYELSETPKLDVIHLGEQSPQDKKTVSWGQNTTQEFPSQQSPPKNNESITMFKGFMENVESNLNLMKMEIHNLKHEQQKPPSNAVAQNPLVNNILSRMKRREHNSSLNDVSYNVQTIQDVTNYFSYEKT